MSFINKQLRGHGINIIPNITSFRKNTEIPVKGLRDFIFSLLFQLGSEMGPFKLDFLLA